MKMLFFPDAWWTGDGQKEQTLFQTHFVSSLIFASFQLLFILSYYSNSVLNKHLDNQTQTETEINKILMLSGHAVLLQK